MNAEGQGVAETLDTKERRAQQHKEQMLSKQ
jgi:hypothetical protein